MNDRCRGLFGRIRCNFEARYDEKPTTPEHILAMGQAYPLHDMKLGTTDTYVCDVCTACGEVRNRPTPSMEPKT